MKGKGSFLVILWWLIGCLCLGALLILLAPKQERPSTEENRMLAGAPVLSVETLKSGAFFSGVEDYLSDGFFERDDVINATDRLLGLFDLRTEEQRFMQEEADVNRQLAEDAGEGRMEETLVDPTATPIPALTATPKPTATLEPTATPTPEPTAPPTPEPTPVPTPEPTATIVPTATPTPAASPTPVITSVPTATPIPTPFATMTPAPTATPKAIVPLEEKAAYGLYFLRADNTRKEYYTYPAENLVTFAGYLNFLKGMLPEEGEIHYMQVPVSSVGVQLCTPRSKYIGWESTMEDALQTQVENNIYIHNIPAILNDHLAAKEMDLYYFTDHHWTGKGAWYALEAVMQARGVPVVPYDEYPYETQYMGKSDSGYEDWIEAMVPLAPVRSVILSKLTQERESVLMNYKVRNYVAYLNGTETPWRKIDTGYGTNRKALVICDSFGNAFVPYLLPYYDEVHMTDLRYEYYSVYEAGGTFAELVNYHQIDDIYIILSTSNGINSPNSQKVFWQEISR